MSNNKIVHMRYECIHNALCMENVCIQIHAERIVIDAYMWKCVMESMKSF